ncbi:hypothetical protein NHQ30_003193 [Ciborinia camelliae]|nr:hypothetical protein NHQ30_003193 [Ciborinia camelliae]
MVGVKTWTDDGIWYVLLASEMTKPNTSSGPRNGRPNRRFTDEDIAILCRQNVEDLNHIPDANGVKYVRGSKKSDYQQPNAPRPSPAVLAAIDRLRRQYDTPSQGQENRSENRSRASQKTGGANLRQVQGSGGSANTTPIPRSPILRSPILRSPILRAPRQGPRQVPMQNPMQSPSNYSQPRSSNLCKKTRDGHRLDQWKEEEGHQMSGMEDRSRNRSALVQDSEAMDFAKSQRNVPLDNDSQRQCQGSLGLRNSSERNPSEQWLLPPGNHTQNHAQNPRQNPFISKPGTESLARPRQPMKNPQRMNMSMHNGNQLSRTPRHMSRDGMYQLQGNQMGFNTSNFQSYIPDYNNRTSSSTNYTGYPQFSHEMSGNGIMMPPGQARFGGSLNSYYTPLLRQPYEGMMAHMNTQYLGHQQVGTNFSGMPSYLDFNGMPAAQLMNQPSHGLPATTSDNFDFNIGFDNQILSNNFGSPGIVAAERNTLSQELQPSGRNKRKYSTGIDEAWDGKSEMDSNGSGERDIKRVKTEVIGEAEQIHFNGQMSTQQRTSNTPELLTVVPIPSPVSAPVATPAVTPAISPVITPASHSQSHFGNDSNIRDEASPSLSILEQFLKGLESSPFERDLSDFFDEPPQGNATPIALNRSDKIPSSQTDAASSGQVVEASSNQPLQISHSQHQTTHGATSSNSIEDAFYIGMENFINLSDVGDLDYPKNYFEEENLQEDYDYLNDPQSNK